MTVLIDSWAWIEYFKGSEVGKKVNSILEQENDKIISTINIAEVFRHLLINNPENKALEAIKFMIDSCFVKDVNTKIAINAAKLKHIKKLGLGDAIILATTENNIKLVTGDPDFKNESNVIYLGK